MEKKGSPLLSSILVLTSSSVSLSENEIYDLNGVTVSLGNVFNDDDLGVFADLGGRP